MTANRADLTKRKLDNALRALDPEDRRRIKAMAENAELRMRAKGEETGFHVMFGPLSAMELIARVGIFINKGGMPSK